MGGYLIKRTLRRIKAKVIRFFKSSLVRLKIALRRNSTRHENIFTPKYGVRKLRDPHLGSFSGPGSTVIRTEAIRKALPSLLKELDCKVLIDAPCGDFKWMQHVELPVEKYIGVDVIRELVAINNRVFANKQRSFIHMDMTEHVLPRGDVVLSRDVLIHLCFKDIAKFISLLKQSGSKHLLVSHFPEQTSNPDIATGDWRPVNLELAPFRFPQPLQTISEHYKENMQHSDKCLALWKISSIPLFEPE